ncbi:MAG TPA: ABC transporter substrate-binding protein, partial [Xanthobacteraceae bacterium]|nr:ABC transporter substrate-binding protein [Xanthobacteraceae bacterium]
WLAALRQGLEKLGWSEGRNIHFEFRWSGFDMELMQRQAKELVALQPDLIFTSSSPIIGTVLRLTKTIPVVFPNIVDPVGQGFAASLSRPGGNATGLVNLEPSMAGKWIGLLKEVTPRLARVVIAYNPASSPYAGLYLDYFKSTAPRFGVEVITAPVADMSEFKTIAATQARELNTGFVLLPSAFMSGYAREIGALMAQHQLPAVSFTRDFAISGGLLAYGNDIADNYRRAAKFIDRILKGEKPADIPIEFPVKFSLVINLKTAQALGLVVPTHLQQLADEVIE